MNHLLNMSLKYLSFLACIIAIGAATALLLVGTAVGEITRTGLVAEYHFDGDAKDSSENRNDGTIYGATFVDGKLGKALRFDGVDDYVEVAESTSLSITNAITVEAWAKPGYSNNWAGIVAKDAWGMTRAWNMHKSDSEHSNTFHSEIREEGGGYSVINSGVAVNWDKWYHVAITYDGQYHRLFVNGELETSNPFTGTIHQIDVPVTIGSAYRNGYFNGIIDEVRIYNHALSDSEIKAIYESYPTVPETSEEHTSVVFEEDFEGEDNILWGESHEPDGGWFVVTENGNHVLKGINKANIGLKDDTYLADHTFEAKLKLKYGIAGIGVRRNREGEKLYWINFNQDYIELTKGFKTKGFTTLTHVGTTFTLDEWHSIGIVCIGANIKVYVDNMLKLDYTDTDDPSLSGYPALDSEPNSLAYFDDFRVTSSVPTATHTPEVAPIVTPTPMPTPEVEPTPTVPPVPVETPAPTPTPYREPDFSLYLIIFLVCSLAIGLPLIFVFYRKGKPPSEGVKQQKPPEFDDYTQKIEGYRAKMEEWAKEGYDVSELKEVLEGKK